LSNSELRIGRRQALAVVLSQCVLGAICAIACLALRGLQSGLSALLGAGIAVAATSLMAFALLRHGDGASAQRVAWSFFSGWLVKVLLTIVLLGIALSLRKVEALPLLAAYAVTYLGYWVGSARANRDLRS